MRSSDKHYCLTGSRKKSGRQTDRQTGRQTGEKERGRRLVQRDERSQ